MRPAPLRACASMRGIRSAKTLERMSDADWESCRGTAGILVVCPLSPNRKRVGPLGKSAGADLPGVNRRAKRGERGGQPPLGMRLVRRPVGHGHPALEIPAAAQLLLCG